MALAASPCASSMARSWWRRSRRGSPLSSWSSPSGRSIKKNSRIFSSPGRSSGRSPNRRSRSGSRYSWPPLRRGSTKAGLTFCSTASCSASSNIVTARPRFPSLNCSMAACTSSRKRVAASSGASARDTIWRIALSCSPTRGGALPATTGRLPQPGRVRARVRRTWSIVVSTPNWRRGARCSSSSFAVEDWTAAAVMNCEATSRRCSMGAREVPRAGVPPSEEPGTGACRCSRNSDNRRRPRVASGERVAEVAWAARAARAASAPGCRSRTGMGSAVVPAREAWRRRSRFCRSSSRSSSGHCGRRASLTPARQRAMSGLGTRSSSPMRAIFFAPWKRRSATERSAAAGRWYATQAPISAARSCGGCWTRRARESTTIKGGTRSDRYC